MTLVVMVMTMMTMMKMMKVMTMSVLVKITGSEVATFQLGQ